jgi:hypothetical protein
MSFKIKFREDLFRVVTREAKVALQESMQSKKLGQDIGSVVIRDIQVQTRAGKSIPSGGRLKPLSKTWIELRKEIIKANGAENYVKPARSNLSLSSQLLNSMDFNQKATSRGLEISFFFRGIHQPYKLPFKKKWVVKNAFGRGQNLVFTRHRPGMRNLGDKISNETLAEYVERKRPFIGVRPQVQATLRQLVLREVRRLLRLR